MSDIRSTLGVAVAVQGTADDTSPRRHVYDHFHIWSTYELFYGDIGKDRFVPNVGDLVVDADNAAFARVTTVDESSFIHTTVPVSPGYQYSDISDVLGVTDMGYERLFIDKTTTPYTAIIDQSIRIAGSAASYCIVFNDSVLGPNSRSISKIFKPNGDFDTDRIPLEKISTNGAGVVLLSKPTSFKITEELANAEIVTAVFYDDVGNVIFKKRLRSEDTGYIKEVTENFKVIEGIYLKTLFLEETTPDTIIRQNNMLLDEMNVNVVVKYSDGSEKELSISDPHISLFGIEPMEELMDEDTEITITVSYTLEDDETAVSTGGDGRFITRDYTVKSVYVLTPVMILNKIAAAGNLGKQDGEVGAQRATNGHMSDAERAAYNTEYDAGLTRFLPVISLIGGNSLTIPLNIGQIGLENQHDFYMVLDGVFGVIKLECHEDATLEYAYNNLDVWAPVNFENSFLSYYGEPSKLVSINDDNKTRIRIRGVGVDSLRIADIGGKFTALKMYRNSLQTKAAGFLSGSLYVKELYVSENAFSNTHDFRRFVGNSSLEKIGNLNTSSGTKFNHAFKVTSNRLECIGSLDTSLREDSISMFSATNTALTAPSIGDITGIEAGGTWTNPSACLPDLVDSLVEYADPGFTAMSQLGVDYHDDVIVTGTVNASVLGTYTLSHNITVNNHVVPEKVKTINIVPASNITLTLQGNVLTYIAKDMVFVDPGAVAHDNDTGNDVSTNITVSGTVDTGILGTYLYTYSIMDSAGVLLEVVRAVQVIPNLAPVLTVSGPSVNTITSQRRVYRVFMTHLYDINNVTFEAKTAGMSQFEVVNIIGDIDIADVTENPNPGSPGIWNPPPAGRHTILFEVPSDYRNPLTELKITMGNPGDFGPEIAYASDIMRYKDVDLTHDLQTINFDSYQGFTAFDINTVNSNPKTYTIRNDYLNATNSVHILVDAQPALIEYVEQTATAEDPETGSVPVVITYEKDGNVVTTVDTTTSGSTIVTYSAGDPQGNVASETKEVILT